MSISINTPAHYIYDHRAWPAKYPPRPYLCAAVVHLLEAVDAGQRGIVHLPTGTGKTVQVGKVTEHYYHRGKRTLFLHHRRELRTQTLNKFWDFGLEPEVEEASSRACKRSLNPVIASVLSLQGSRLRSWPRDAFHLIVTDECHHAEATSYQKIYNHLSGAKAHIGVTATVDRHDRKSLLKTYFYCNRFKDRTTAQLVSPCERRGGNFPVALYQ